MDPRTPVIVGVGQVDQRPDDLSTALEASALMTEAVRVALADAGAPSLAGRVDTIATVEGAWRYPDPGRLVAEAIGSPSARTVHTSNGGNTPQSLVNEMGRRIAAGTVGAAVITGGETIWTRRRMRRAGIDRSVTIQDPDVEPDERFGADVAMSTDFDAGRGLTQPIEFYPLFDSAIRGREGRSVDEHRDHLARLWADFNEVAVANPHAWDRTPMTAAEIREPTPTNRMVGFPYTKAMNSNWDLDQAAALVLCSAEVAEASGVLRDRWVFPWSGTDAHDTLVVLERPELGGSPAIRIAGARALELAGCGIDDLAHVDLYSCFPSAVQIGAHELGLSLDRRLTVTGGLCFAGGPLNNYVTHSIATMCDVLRGDPGALGLVTANGGYVTKHAMGVYATEPPPLGFRTANVQDEVEAVPSTTPDPSFVGRGTIEAATVMHDADGPVRGIAAIRTPASARTWASTDDATTMAWLMDDGHLGAEVEVSPGGHLER